MSTNNYDAGSPHQPQAAEPSAKPTEAQPSGSGKPNAFLDLAREIDSLSASGQDETRLRQLIRARDDERLRQIDKCLTEITGKDLQWMLELIKCDAEYTRLLKAEMIRTDLTFGEMCFLHNVCLQKIRQEKELLLAEKKGIEQKRRPGTRRGRGMT